MAPLLPPHGIPSVFSNSAHSTMPYPLLPPPPRFQHTTPPLRSTSSGYLTNHSVSSTPHRLCLSNQFSSGMLPPSRAIPYAPPPPGPPPALSETGGWNGSQPPPPYTTQFTRVPRRRKSSSSSRSLRHGDSISTNVKHFSTMSDRFHPASSSRYSHTIGRYSGGGNRSSSTIHNETEKEFLDRDSKIQNPCGSNSTSESPILTLHHHISHTKEGVFNDWEFDSCQSSGNFEPVDTVSGIHLHDIPATEPLGESNLPLLEHEEGEVLDVSPVVLEGNHIDKNLEKITISEEHFFAFGDERLNNIPFHLDTICRRIEDDRISLVSDDEEEPECYNFWESKVQVRPLSTPNVHLNEHRSHQCSSSDILVFKLSSIDLSCTSTLLNQLVYEFLPFYRRRLDAMASDAKQKDANHMKTRLPRFAELFLLQSHLTSKSLECLMTALEDLDILPTALHLGTNPDLGSEGIAFLGTFIKRSREPLRWLSIAKCNANALSLESLLISVLARSDIYPRSSGNDSIPLWLDLGSGSDTSKESKNLIQTPLAENVFNFLDTIRAGLYCKVRNRMICGINRCGTSGAVFHIPKLPVVTNETSLHQRSLSTDISIPSCTSELTTKQQDHIVPNELEDRLSVVSSEPPRLDGSMSEIDSEEEEEEDWSMHSDDLFTLSLENKNNLLQQDNSSIINFPHSEVVSKLCSVPSTCPMLIPSPECSLPSSDVESFSEINIQTNPIVPEDTLSENNVIKNSSTKSVPMCQMNENGQTQTSSTFYQNEPIFNLNNNATINETVQSPTLLPLTSVPPLPYTNHLLLVYQSLLRDIFLSISLIAADRQILPIDLLRDLSMVFLNGVLLDTISLPSLWKTQPSDLIVSQFLSAQDGKDNNYSLLSGEFTIPPSKPSSILHSTNKRRKIQDSTIDLSHAISQSPSNCHSNTESTIITVLEESSADTSSQEKTSNVPQEAISTRIQNDSLTIQPSTYCHSKPNQVQQVSNTSHTEQFNGTEINTTFTDNHETGIHNNTIEEILDSDNDDSLEAIDSTILRIDNNNSLGRVPYNLVTGEGGEEEEEEGEIDEVIIDTKKSVLHGTHHARRPVAAKSRIISSARHNKFLSNYL